MISAVSGECVRYVRSSTYAQSRIRQYFCKNVTVHWINTDDIHNNMRASKNNGYERLQNVERREHIILSFSMWDQCEFHYDMNSGMAMQAISIWFSIPEMTFSLGLRP